MKFDSELDEYSMMDPIRKKGYRLLISYHP